MPDLQSTFLAAIVLEDEYSIFDNNALAVYRNNLYASAKRALEISHPTLHQLCGDDFFRQLAIKYFKGDPFCQGDWAEWGDKLAVFLNESLVIKDYPYFPDIAKLDWAIHCTERYIDQTPNTKSFHLLASENIGELYLAVSPLVSFIESDFPIVDIFNAHQIDEDAEYHMQLAREKITGSVGQTAIIYRPQFKAYIDNYSNEEMHFIKSLQKGTPLGEAIEHVPDTFDFQQWLTESVEKKIILGVDT